MNYRDLVNIIEGIAPNEAYREIDNSGEQIYVGKDEIKKVLVCLEINQAVMDEAVSKNVDMILTHHPLIFNPEKFINYEDYPGRYIQDAVKNNINVYSAHLSFDFAPKGNNVYIAQLLGIELDEGGSMAEGYYGTFKTINRLSFNDVCNIVKENLNLPDNYIRCVDGGKDHLCKVGLCTGAGGSYIFDAAKRGCDVFITGDLRLHEAQYAKAMGMSVIDAGHYGTEKIFAENMARQLQAKAAEKGVDIDVIMAEADTNPYTL